MIVVPLGLSRIRTPRLCWVNVCLSVCLCLCLSAALPVYTADIFERGASALRLLPDVGLWDLDFFNTSHLIQHSFQFYLGAPTCTARQLVCVLHKTAASCAWLTCYAGVLNRAAAYRSTEPLPVPRVECTPIRREAMVSYATALCGVLGV